METKFQTSFIPKAPISSNAGVKIKRPLGFFLYFSTVIFLLSLVLAGGVYAYDKYLSKKILDLENTLNTNNKSFEPQTIDEYVRLASRMQVAKGLLEKHVASSRIFDYLGEATLKSVKFDDFRYDLTPEGKATIKLSGVARSYNAVADQSRIFGGGNVFEESLFSNLDLNQQGNVVFTFQAKVSDTFLKYAKKVEEVSKKVEASEDQTVYSSSNLETLPAENSNPAPASSQGSIPQAIVPVSETSSSQTQPQGGFFSGNTINLDNEN